MWLTALTLFFGCSNEGVPTGHPVVEAQATGAGYWPANSGTGVREATRTGLARIEVDLVLSRDGVPMLHNAEVVDRTRCTHPDGSLLDDPVVVAETTASALQRDHLCGGIPQPDHPSAEVFAEPMMTLDEMLVQLQHFAEPTIHLDLVWSEESGVEADVFAEAVVSRWLAADLPNALLLSAGDLVLVDALEQQGRQTSHDLDVWLVATELPRNGNLLSGAAGADGLWLPVEVADRYECAEARDGGLSVGLYTIDHRDDLWALSEWPVDVLMSHYPLDL